MQTPPTFPERIFPESEIPQTGYSPNRIFPYRVQTGYIVQNVSVPKIPDIVRKLFYEFSRLESRSRVRSELETSDLYRIRAVSTETALVSDKSLVFNSLLALLLLGVEPLSVWGCGG